MSNKIDLVNLDTVDGEALKKMPPLEVAKLGWKEYLKKADYNKDIDLMCDICIAKQKRDYGKIVIPCDGKRDYKDGIKETYGEDIYEEMLDVVHQLDEDSLLELKAPFSPADWFLNNIKDPKKYSERFYQRLVTSCSAYTKVLRQGRRTGKTFSVVMEVMYRIDTADSPVNILVAAPQVTMIDEIRKTIIALDNLLETGTMIEKVVKTPVLEITFKNGSVLQGITAADGGKSARGKKAHIIWIDEADFIDSKSYEAIAAIKLDNDDVRMIFTSTPIGERLLYNIANKEYSKEFHYPTYVSPVYSDQKHKENIDEFSEAAFCQEFIALYGVDDSGVFQQQHIEKSFNLYVGQFYNETFVLEHRDRFILIIGVDWNHDNNGTRILVIAYDKELGRFFVVAKENIAKLHQTQSLSIQKVVDLNRKYRPDHIMCDEGFGTAQISELRMIGMKQRGKVPVGHPDLDLVNVQSINFASNVEIRDPVTNEIIKRRAKVYIVDNAVKMLEDGKLAFDETLDHELIQQMKNYAIVKTTLTGNVYKARNPSIGDHDLDAFMIALYCFDANYSEFNKFIPDGHIASFIKENPYMNNARLTSEVTTGIISKSFSRRRSTRASFGNSRAGFKPKKRW